MDKYKTQAITYLSKLTKLASGHALFGFILLFSALAGFLVLKSGQLTNLEPSESEIFETRSTVQKIKIDEKSLRVVEELNSRNISLDSLFVERENPFEN